MWVSGSGANSDIFHFIFIFELPKILRINDSSDFMPQRYPMEEEGSYGKNLRPEDILADEDHQYESEEENIEIKTKEKPLGPPLELEVPLRPPPALPEKVCL